MRLLPGAALFGLLLAAAPLTGQATGVITGTVRVTGEAAGPIEGARVTVDGGRHIVTTDARGTYRIREVAAGWHVVTAAAIGHRPVSRDSVLVQSGLTTPLDFELREDPVGLEPMEVIAERVDSVLDPFAIQDQQRFGAEDLRRLPVSSVDEAIGLSAGAVGESYRGGRLGQQAFILDGLGLKNQVDASTGTLGVRLPPDMLAEASLITNGFSARYGQAVSALVNLTTRDGADRWGGRLAYETDRPLGDGADYGLDRGVLSVEGPLPAGIRFIAVADLSARVDADPVNAPAPVDPRDPRHDQPWLLPHNSGEQGDLSGKLTIPLGQRQTLRILGVHSADQRFLYDPAYKYDPALGPVQRVTGNLVSGHLQRTFTGSDITADLRVGYFGRDFVRGTAEEDPDFRFGAFTGQKIDIAGEDLARRQDTTAAMDALPGFIAPTYSTNSPWGVPAFFLGRASRGNIAWNHFREWRGRLDVNVPAGRNTDVYLGGEYTGQRVQTFQRILGYLPVGDTVPAPSVSDFTPWSGALFSEVQARSNDLALTVGLRYDQFSGRDDLPSKQAGGTKHSLSPRFALSTVFRGATFVASLGRFSQAPDYQYLVDAAFDDTLRTGRFRQGNANLGFETSTQYEFSLRVRPTPLTSVRANVYVRRLDGLVASVPLGQDPDSSIFGNVDAGTVRGVELITEREFARGWGVRVSYTLQEAKANSSNAFLTRRATRIDPLTGDTITPAKVEFPLDYDRRHSLTAIVTGTVPESFGPRLFGSPLLGGFEGTSILRYASGLPFSRYASADSLIGLPNENRLPSTVTVDLLLRRPVRLGRVGGSVYLDVRNLLDRRNIIALRRDNGQLRINPADLQDLVDSVYARDPYPIPYESPRYRAWADTDHNGYVDGAAELRPLYLAAARDANQPLFFYGPPRLFRLGMEVTF